MSTFPLLSGTVTVSVIVWTISVVVAVFRHTTNIVFPRAFRGMTVPALEISSMLSAVDPDMVVMLAAVVLRKVSLNAVCFNLNAKG
jgi:hypothetical protein